MVMPGSLDYLYYNGVLDHIPYYAYDSIPYNQSQFGNQYSFGGNNLYGNHQYASGQFASNQYASNNYLNTAMQGNAYNTYNHPDTFVRRNDYGHYSIREHAFSPNNGYGSGADFEVMANGEDGKNFRETIMSTASKAKESVANAPSYVKGLLAGGVILGTLAMLFKGKKSVAYNSTGFWAKVNPLNWFKKV